MLVEFWAIADAYPFPSSTRAVILSEFWAIPFSMSGMVVLNTCLRLLSTLLRLIDSSLIMDSSTIIFTVQVEAPDLGPSPNISMNATDTS